MTRGRTVVTVAKDLEVLQCLSIEHERPSVTQGIVSLKPRLGTRVTVTWLENSSFLSTTTAHDYEHTHTHTHTHLRNDALVHQQRAEVRRQPAEGRHNLILSNRFTQHIRPRSAGVFSLLIKVPVK